MEASAVTPQALIPAAAQLPGASPASGIQPAARPAQDGGPERKETQDREADKDNFKNTFNKLKDKPNTNNSPSDQPAEAAEATDSPAEPPPANSGQPPLTASESTRPLSPEGEFALAAEAEPGGSELPPVGKLLPATEVNEVNPDIATPLTTAADPDSQAALPQVSELPAAAPIAVTPGVLPATPVMPSPVETTPAQSLNQTLAGARSAAPATGLSGTDLSNLGANAGDQSGSSGGDGMNQQAQTPAMTVRELLAQAATSTGARISVSPGADGAAALQNSAAPAASLAGPPPAVFSDTLSSLTPPDARPLQPLADNADFAQRLGQRMMVMSDNGLQTARIKLHPEHLGPLDIRVQIEDDTAKVWFNVQHGQTRDAVEQALPRLKEMFAEQGLQLTRSEVGSGEHSAGDPSQQMAEGSQPTDWRDGDAPGAEPQLMNMALGRADTSRLLDVMA